MKNFNGTTQIYLCKSIEISEESTENITKLDSLFSPTFVNHYTLPDVKLNGHCLINNRISILKKVIDHRSMVKKSKHRFYFK